VTLRHGAPAQARSATRLPRPRLDGGHCQPADQHGKGTEN
jgi:hypothetical protein